MITGKGVPFFYDVTLRDGNQALKKPWNTGEKEKVFLKLVNLGVQGIEVGFSGASEMDFEACEHLANIAPGDVVISGLARTLESDIQKVYDSIRNAKKPRIHTFIALSPFSMKFVLKRQPKDVQKIAVEACAFARELLGKKGSVQFSAEHFGDSKNNLNFVIETFEKCISAGADVINLPNTVERTRVSDFIEMVKKVARVIGKYCTIAVHCHNDLGMGTATTVESFFAGATQLEVSLNGLGERAGNTNLFEVAVSLHNSGVKVPLRMQEIYETAVFISEISGVPIYEKAPLIGPDALAHRSGIHQDGTIKTMMMKKGAYRPIHPTLIGRDSGDYIGFTSQSGKTAIYELLTKAGLPITMHEAVYLQPFMKSLAEKKGELSIDDMEQIYFDKLFNIKGKIQLIKFEEVQGGKIHKYRLHFIYKDRHIVETGTGEGPIEAVIDAINRAGFPVSLVHFHQMALDEEKSGARANAITVIKLKNKETNHEILCRGMSRDTRKANINAIFNGLNLLFK
ncbi:MAG: 2-isopropylmalate synthase LeuA2 [Candidatus Hydrogenedentota bacterium]